MSIPEDLAEIKLAAEIRKMAAPVGALGAGLGGLAGMAQAYLSDSDEDIQAPLSHRLKRYALRGLGGAAAGAGLEHMLRSKSPAPAAPAPAAPSTPAPAAQAAPKVEVAGTPEASSSLYPSGIPRMPDLSPELARAWAAVRPGISKAVAASGQALTWAAEKALPFQDAVDTLNLEAGAAGAIGGATLGAVAQPHISAAVKGTARKNIRADLAGDAVTSPLAKAVYDAAAKFNISDSPLAKLRRWTRGQGDVNDEISRFVDKAIDRIHPRPKANVEGRVADIRANKPGARTVKGQENVKKSPLRSEVAEQIRADRAKYQQEKAKIVSGPKGEAADKPDAAKDGKPEDGKAKGGKSKGKTSKAAIVQRIQDAMKIRRPDSTDGVMKGRKTGLVVGGLGGLLQGLAYGKPPSKERLPVNLVPEEQGR